MLSIMCTHTVQCSVTSVCWQNTNKTRMWANAQRDGRPPKIGGGALCSMPQSFADAHY